MCVCVCVYGCEFLGVCLYVCVFVDFVSLCFLSVRKFNCVLSGCVCVCVYVCVC